MSPRSRFGRALKALSRALGASGRPAMLIGGVAVIAHGVPRVTRDIDATVLGQGTDLESLARTLADQAIEPRIPDAIAFARSHQVLLLRHAPTGIEIDLSLAWLPFEEESIAAAVPARLHGSEVKLARPEDLVIYKIVAWRPQDQADVEGLVALHGSRMDLTRIRRLTRDIAEALEAPERVAELELLLSRAL